MLPSITESNKPKKPTAFNMANKRAESELTGFDEAFSMFEQKRKYAGGQMDLFPSALSAFVYPERWR